MAVMQILTRRSDIAGDGTWGWIFGQGDVFMLLRGEQRDWAAGLDSFLAERGFTRSDLLFESEAERRAFVEDFEGWYEPTWNQLTDASRVELRRLLDPHGPVRPTPQLVADIRTSGGLAVTAYWAETESPDAVDVIPSGFLRWVANGGPAD